MTARGVVGAGAIVKQHRQRVGLTQAGLAEAIGVSLWTVREVEQGRRGIGERSLRLLATRFGTPFLREVRAVR